VVIARRKGGLIMDKAEAREKKDILVKNLNKLPSLLVAFSGGVDSSFLLAIACHALGDRVLAVTAHSVIHTEDELEWASLFAERLGVEHTIIESDEMSIPEFISNPSDRCYYCKKSIAAGLRDIADKRGIKNIAHAINTDDYDDFRPGIKAAKEIGLISPLVEAGLSKEEIRFLSREMGIETWDKPSNACLASRIPYGSSVTPDKLRMIDDAERILKDKGFRQARVRHYGTMARIEVEESNIDRFNEVDLRREVVKKFKEIGFKHIAIDLEGYISGSMNRDLDNV
jgi:uncharacterized protein